MAWKPDYVALEDAKKWVRLKTTDTLDDAEIEIIISTASRAVDRHCNRQFGKTAGAETRYYTPWFDDERLRWIADVDDFMSTTGLVVTIGGVTTTTFTKEPINASQDGKPWEALAFDPATASVVPRGVEYEVAVTANPFGWTNIPPDVAFATRLQISRFLIRRDSPYGIAGTPEQQLRLLSKLDPDVAVALSDLIRARAVG